MPVNEARSPGSVTLKEANTKGKGWGRCYKAEAKILSSSSKHVCITHLLTHLLHKSESTNSLPNRQRLAVKRVLTLPGKQAGRCHCSSSALDQYTTPPAAVHLYTQRRLRSIETLHFSPCVQLIQENEYEEFQHCKCLTHIAVDYLWFSFLLS